MTLSLFGHKRLILNLRIEQARDGDARTLTRLEQDRQADRELRRLDDAKNQFLLIRGPHL